MGIAVKVDIKGDPNAIKRGVEEALDRAMPKSRTADVHELIDLTEAQLDPENYTVKGARIIKAGWSLNERYYPDEVLAKSAGIWEGVKAYADHPSKDELKNRPERSVRDVVGVYSQPRHENGKTVADLKVLGEARSWLWPLIQETIDTGMPVVGLSINALGSARKGEAEGKKGIVVEAITHANSVDVVTTSAAGGGFTLLASDDGWSHAVISTMTLDELREARPELIEDLKREWKSTRDSEALKESRAETEAANKRAARLTEEHRVSQEALAEALDKVQELQKELLADRLLADLPKEVRGELKESLMQSPTIEAMQAEIERTLKVLGAVRLPVRVTGAGRAATPMREVMSRPTHPLAEALGIDPALARAETIDEFLEAKKRQ